MKNNETYIYILKCPETNEIKYVGKSNDPKRRYYGHLRVEKTACSYKKNWVKSLLSQNLKPTLEIIKKVPMKKWKYWERYYINYYKNKGYKLVNLGQGGEGLGFGNQTSFKKGIKPWNVGIRKMKKCAICEIEFPVSPSGDKKYKCCSIECSSTYRSLNPNKGTFKRGSKPWNKNINGYSTSKKGQVMSDDNKINISKALRGRTNTGASKPVGQINKNNHKIIKEYKSSADASRQTGISHSSILNNVSGRSKSAGGYIWKRKEKTQKWDF